MNNFLFLILLDSNLKKNLPQHCWGGFFFRIEPNKIKNKITSLMIKYFLFLFLSLMFFNLSLAKDINIQENIKLSFVCDLDKKIIIF